MSNMGPFGNNKNPPWARGGVGNAAGGIVGQASPLQQQMLQQGTMGAMGATGMVQYQQSQPVFQTPMGMQQQNMGIGIQQITGNPSVSMSSALGQQLNPSQLFSQVGAVTYPNPRALNPTAFQTPGLTSVATGPGPGSVQVPTSQANSSTKQRVFTGTVTKVHDNFGFVDEDVFFQTTACVKGSNPVVGDRVLVEASFNPTMPFKWNATRIQVLPMSGNATGTSIGSGVVAGVNAALARAAQQAVSKSFTTGSSGYNAVPPPIETTNGNYQSSARSVQRSGKGSVGGRSRDRSRDRDRDDEEIERKRRREERGRDREEKDKKSPLRRRSRSPKSRRRVRVVPRYMVQIPKIALHLPEADVLEIRRRYTNLYVPSDFFHSQFRWIDAFPPHSPFTLNKPCQFHIMSKDIDSISETEAVLEPPDADYLFSAKVMLMSVPTMDEIYSKCCSIAEDMGRKDRDSEERDFVHPTRLINFLVGLRGKNETMAIGGPWSPSLDGENPDKDPSVLIKTAIRTCKALTGIDLSNCTQWYRFVELYYRRAETSHRGKLVAARVETVVLFLPDVWSCVPTRLEWDALHQAYRKQLERRLRADHGDDCVDEPSNADEKEEEAASENKAEPTHYSQLDPKTMSLPALRTELKARGINSKGLKSQLIARLGRALKSEIEKTENEDHNMETDQNDSKIEIEEKEDKRKENDEKRLDEREKQQLEKRYALPDEQHIIVHPSRIAKSGKFDCTIMSLSLLLDYRPEDTKEHSFEVSLFAELFNEMLMRDFAFIIYKAIHDHPERTKETKDDKKKKDDDKKNKRDDKDKKDDKNDKKDKDDRKDDKRKGKDDDDDEVVEDVDDDDDDDKKDKGEKRKSTDRDRKKKERIQLVTKDKNLLLSFVYFDQTHCGYIFEKDMEDLIYTLGLSLSRAQVRKLVSKVVTRDSLHYRKLTDRLKEELDQPSNTVSTTEEQTELPPSAEELAYGNKKLLPIFKNGSVPRNSINNMESNREMEENCSNDKTQLAEGLVMYQGALMDVGKLLNQLNRSEKARIDTETRMIELKKENTKLTEKNEKSSNIIKNLTGELSDCKKKLQNSDDALHKVTNCSNLYHSTLLEIKEKIEPVIGMSGMKNQHPDVSEIKKEGHESRWEVEIKTEIKEENSTDKNEQTIVIQE